jgi:hypothetical protein
MNTRLRFRIRDWLWVTAIVSALLGWWLDHVRYSNVVIVIDPSEIARSVPATSNVRIMYKGKGSVDIRPVDK